MEEKEERPLANSCSLLSTTKILSPFLNSPTTFVIPAANKLFPFFSAFAAPPSINIFAEEPIEPTIHFFLATKVDILGTKQV